MNQLTDLQHKYPNAKHEPNPLCPACCGVGEYATQIVGHTRVVPCECIFFKGEYVMIVRKLLKGAKDE